MTEPAADAEPLSIEVRRGAPTDEELAALIAVVGEAYAAEASDARVSERPTRSRWDLSARGLRAPLARERGWGGFAL